MILAGFWSCCTNEARLGIVGNFAPSLGISGSAASRVLLGVFGGILILFGLLLLSHQEAQGAKGSVQARARVVERLSSEELDRARSEIFHRYEAALHGMGTMGSMSIERGGRGPLRSRIVERGHMRLTLEEKPERDRLTLEYLAN